MPHVLLIDDDPILILDQIGHLSEQLGITIEVAQSGGAGLDRVATSMPDVVLLDVNLPDQTGLDVYHEIRKIDARIPVVFITATATTGVAIEAMRLGAYDYLFKPVELRQLARVLGEAVELGRRMHQPATASTTTPTDEQADSIIGRSAAMQEVYKAIGRVTDQNVIVLITGESGTGKELVARAVYQHSDRKHAPFLALNCAAIPESLLESELFGHEKGAFTGADRRQVGKFERCNGGTIFLDEIGDMPLATQGKVLRLLQDQRFERVGGSRTIETDVRIIAATNRGLKARAEAGMFRADLYYRLNVFTIAIPPLRDRGEDLPLLVNFYVRRFNRELGRDVREVASETLDLLRGYAWPGNVRELQSVLKQAMLRTRATVLGPESLPELPSGPTSDENDRADETPFSFETFIRRRLHADSLDLHAEAHQELDRLLLADVLKFTQGNQLKAARVLGIARQTLRNRLRELGLAVTWGIEGNEVAHS
ncbi:MAG: sigma-54-dependent Fis family transcriptional regulator [Phycisphaerales bacterium]|nr:sigma-54-dependent Fis family transcriptional regulator [Phycisphaerales bacterium]